MGAINKSVLAEMAVELEIQSSALSGAGTWDLIGTLAFEPVHIVFDNQTDLEVKIGNDESNTWHSFPAGEAIILDMRANHGVADNMLFRKGMNLYASGVAGAAGQYFRISYTYALPTRL